MKNIAIIGSTGSIGTQALDIIEKSNGELKVYSLSAGSNGVLLKEQIQKYKPKIATLEVGDVVVDDCKIYLGGNSYLNAITEEVDIVLVACTGFDGYFAVKKAIELGIDVALACKEALVCGGEILMKSAKERGVNIYPVDSEHSAIWQCLNMDSDKEFYKLLITASGGALRDYDKEMLKSVTVEDVLNHPTWKMGKKITVDCATLMNKGFEVIEAMRLFNCSADDIEVVIHRQSIIHSMVEFKDGSVIAQMGIASMETPISLALYGGKRVETGLERLDLTKIATLDFAKIESGKYPCFSLALECAKKGGLYPTALCSADEVAVDMFLKGQIGFTEIYDRVKFAVECISKDIDNLPVTEENLIYVDSTARKCVKEYSNAKSHIIGR